MKYLIIVFVLCAYTTAHGQEKQHKKAVSLNKIYGTALPYPKGLDVLYVVQHEGTSKEISKDEFEKINTRLVASIDVLRDSSAINQFGKRGRNGVVILYMKDRL